MKAVVYHGPFKVTVEDVPDPRIEELLDAIIRITTANICGSDLHPYEGRPALGGQAEYLRVPWADFNLLELPAGTEHEADFTMLSDIFPTGYHGTELAQVAPGKSVAIFGAGPVGLMAAHSALLRGASQVFVVDKEPDRLALAEQIGATAVKLRRRRPHRGDHGRHRRVRRRLRSGGRRLPGPRPGRPGAPGDGARQPREGRTGYRAHRGGRVYVPQDPDAATEEAKQGRVAFDYGLAFDKGLSIGSGQCPVKRYNRELRDLIIRGRATPSFIVSHELSLEEAVDAYDKFDKRIDGSTKVLLHPATR